jgi:hypothetical protein
MSRRLLLVVAILAAAALPACGGPATPASTAKAECDSRAVWTSVEMKEVTALAVSLKNSPSSTTAARLLTWGRAAIGDARSVAKDCLVLGDLAKVEADLDAMDRSLNAVALRWGERTDEVR